MQPAELGPFRLEQKVGTGANGDVWFARHLHSGLPAAVKVLKPELSMNERALMGFKNEVRAVAALDHPNIITVYDHGVVPLDLEVDTDGAIASGGPYLIMEWASAGTLDEVPRPSSWQDLREILETLLRALAHAHARGVIHRDLKPANILFCGDRDLRPGLKLADFGLAVHRDPEQDVRRLLGTPHYMAPEQWRSAVREQGPWTDLYALGCLVFRVVTGRGPFHATNIKAMKKAHLGLPVPRLNTTYLVPRALQAWVQRLMAKAPADRFQCGADALEVLLKLDGRPAVPPPRRARDVRSRMTGAGLGLFGLRALPLVDRQRERRVLWDGLARAVDGQGAQLCVLRGVPGAGKSRLAHWLGTVAHERGEAELLRATHGSDGGPQDGLGPMVARVLKALGLEEQEQPLRERVVAWLQPWGPVDPYEADALCALVGRGPGQIRLAGPRERASIVLRLLERLCSRRPVIVWLDDVQWGDDSLVFVQELLARQAEQPLPVLVLATLQAKAPATSPRALERLNAAEQGFPERSRLIDVGPLTGQDQQALVQSLLGMEGPLVDEVSALSGGNPLFAVQLVADWVHRDLLEPGAEGFRIREGAHVELPENLARVWVTRLRGLLEFRPEDDARALELAAVLGQQVDPEEWQAACERAWAIPTTDLVDSLMRLRLASSGEAGPEAGWAFVHAMLRAALLDSARSSGRLKVHNRVIAEMLRERKAAPERIAHHLLGAGRSNAALAQLLAAVEVALADNDLDHADTLLEDQDRLLDQLELPPDDWRRLDAEVARARVALDRGERERADQHARSAEERARELGLERRLTQALRVRAELLLAAGDLDQARALIEEAELMARGLGEGPRLGSLLVTQGRVLAALDQVEAALECFEEARDRLLNGGLRLGAAEAGAEQGRALWRAGRRLEARNQLTSALETFEGRGRLRQAAACHADLGALALELGQPAAALRHYALATQQHRAVGAPGSVLDELGDRLANLTRGEDAPGEDPG